MSYIKDLIYSVNKGHRNFGNLIAICQIAVKARKFMLIVSPSGCGKSMAMNYVCWNTPDSYQPTQISVASLGDKTEKMNSFRSVIGIDDIASIQTLHGRTATINTLSQLCYTHRVEPSMHGYGFAIEDFRGSALVGIQGIILRDMVLSPEWEASIKDKALRYYHLYRPLEPNLSLPDFKLKQGIDIDSVKFEPDIESEKWQKLTKLSYSQWSRARSIEHIRDMLKAIAALESRTDVREEDFDLLYRLLKPMAIENVVITKESLEGERILDSDLLNLLVEYYSYGGVYSLADIAQDFQVRIARAYRIMQHQNGNWQQSAKKPTRYRPSEKLKEVLKEYNLLVKVKGESKG